MPGSADRYLSGPEALDSPELGYKQSWAAWCGNWTLILQYTRSSWPLSHLSSPNNSLTQCFIMICFPPAHIFYKISISPIIVAFSTPPAPCTAPAINCTGMSGWTQNSYPLLYFPTKSPGAALGGRHHIMSQETKKMNFIGDTDRELWNSLGQWKSYFVNEYIMRRRTSFCFVSGDGVGWGSGWHL